MTTQGDCFASMEVALGCVYIPELCFYTRILVSFCLALNDSFRGACLFVSEVSLLYYLVKLKALRIAGNQLVVDSFAQSFKNGNVVFTVNVAVDTVLHTVLQHQISKAGVLRARKERRIVKGRNYPTFYEPAAGKAPSGFPRGYRFFCRRH